MNTYKNLEDSQGEESKNSIRLNYRLAKIFISANTIYDKNFTEPEFLVDKLIPRGSLSALVGESDTGKSSFLRQLAFSIVYGDSDFLGFKIYVGCNNVLYISTEDGEMGTSAWMNKYFDKELPKRDLLSKLCFVYSTDGIVSNLKEIVKTNCIDLIIVDSYADLYTGNMNLTNEVRGFLNQYSNLAYEFGTTIVFLHHTNKSTFGKPNKHSISSSHGFEAKMRSVLMLTKDANNEDLRNLSIVKGNYVNSNNKSESYVLRFNSQLSFTNTGDRISLNKLGEESYMGLAKELKKSGKSLREIEMILNQKGYLVSKTTLSRKLN